MLTATVLHPPADPATDPGAGSPPPASADGWARLTERLPEPRWADLPPAGGAAASGGAELPLDDRLELAGEFVLRAFLERRADVSAAEVLRGVPEFAAYYSAPNSVGTLLGKGVAGHGFGLFKRGGRAACAYENAWKVLAKLRPAQRERVAARLGHADPDALAAAVRTLPGLGQ